MAQQQNANRKPNGGNVPNCPVDTMRWCERRECAEKCELLRKDSEYIVFNANGRSQLFQSTDDRGSLFRFYVQRVVADAELTHLIAMAKKKQFPDSYMVMSENGRPLLVPLSLEAVQCAVNGLVKRGKGEV